MCYCSFSTFSFVRYPLAWVFVCAPQAEESMRDRVKKACEDLGNINTLSKEV